MFSGGIAELAKTLSDLGVSIKDMMHERAWIKSDIFSVQVIIFINLRSWYLEAIVGLIELGLVQLCMKENLRAPVVQFFYSASLLWKHVMRSML